MGLSELGVITTLLAGIFVVLAEQRILVLLGFVLHYLAVMLLVVPVLGIEIAAAKLIAGAIASAILWLSISGKDFRDDIGRDLIDRPLFRAASLALVLIAGWGAGRAAWLNIEGLSSAAEIGATLLLALGLMMAAFFEEPFRMGLGIIIFVSGFEVVYAAIEPSLAVLALLAGVQLSLALVISYLVQVAAQQDGESV